MLGPGALTGGKSIPDEDWALDSQTGPSFQVADGTISGWLN